MYACQLRDVRLHLIGLGCTGRQIQIALIRRSGILRPARRFERPPVGQVKIRLAGRQGNLERGIVKDKSTVPKEQAKNADSIQSFVDRYIAFVDPIVIMVQLPRNSVPLAKAELFSNPILGVVPWLYQVIPVRRGEVDRDNIRAALDWFRQRRVCKAALASKP